MDCGLYAYRRIVYLHHDCHYSGFSLTKGGGMMNKQEIVFAVLIKNGEVVKVGRSFIELPPIRYDGRKTKWIDDAACSKKGGAS